MMNIRRQQRILGDVARWLGAEERSQSGDEASRIDLRRLDEELQILRGSGTGVQSQRMRPPIRYLTPASFNDSSSSSKSRNTRYALCLERAFEASVYRHDPLLGGELFPPEPSILHGGLLHGDERDTPAPTASVLVDLAPDSPDHPRRVHPPCRNRTIFDRRRNLEAPGARAQDTSERLSAFSARAPI